MHFHYILRARRTPARGPSESAVTYDNTESATIVINPAIAEEHPISMRSLHRDIPYYSTPKRIVRGLLPLALAATLLMALPTVAQQQAGHLSVPIMPLSEVKVGMTGEAYTVFQGTEPEKMGVEVLGIMRNM